MPSKKNETEEYFVNWTKFAEDDLKDIILFIAQNNPQTALKIHQKILDKGNSLDHFPLRGSYVPELLKTDNKDYRQLTESSWRIIYKVPDTDKIVNIIAIVDSRRDIYEFLVERFLYRDWQ